MQCPEHDLNCLRQPKLLPFSASWRCYLGNLGLEVSASAEADEVIPGSGSTISISPLFHRVCGGETPLVRASGFRRPLPDADTNLTGLLHHADACET